MCAYLKMLLQKNPSSCEGLMGRSYQALLNSFGVIFLLALGKPIKSREKEIA